MMDLKKMLTLSEKHSFVCISDIHLGHGRTSAEDIIEGLRTYLDAERLSKIDAVFINGDLFDRGLRWTDASIGLIESWVVDLLLLCVKYNVKLRVLEGTPSHDRGQNGIFDRFIVHLNIADKLDFRYVSTVFIEYIADFDKHVLYVPDGEVDVDKTFMEVKEALLEKGIERVDYAMMHGSFKYQLPEVAKSPKHDEESYLQIVRYIINIGHIHDASTFGRAYANGSFFCLDHGYEKPKGFWQYEFKAGKVTATFIVNEMSFSHITIDCRGLDLPAALAKIENVVMSGKHRDHSSFRIWGNKGDLILAHISEIKEKYNLYTWSTKQDSAIRVTDTENTTPSTSFAALEINENTISSIIRDRLLSKGTDVTLVENVLNVIEASIKS